MGFNLKMFIEELERILAKGQDSASTVDELELAIQLGKQYAKDCGQL